MKKRLKHDDDGSDCDGYDDGDGDGDRDGDGWQVNQRQKYHNDLWQLIQ